MVIRALPDLSSGAGRRARLLARMVPPMPPPTIKIFIARSPSCSVIGLASSLGLADVDVPNARFLPRAEQVVPDLADPFRDVVRRALVGGEHLELVTDLRHLHPGDQFHQGARTEAPARIDHLPVGHVASCSSLLHVRTTTPATPRRRPGTSSGRAARRDTAPALRARARARPSPSNRGRSSRRRAPRPARTAS